MTIQMFKKSDGAAVSICTAVATAAAIFMKFSVFAVIGTMFVTAAVMWFICAAANIHEAEEAENKKDRDIQEAERLRQFRELQRNHPSYTPPKRQAKRQNIYVSTLTDEEDDDSDDLLNSNLMAATFALESLSQNNDTQIDIPCNSSSLEERYSSTSQSCMAIEDDFYKVPDTSLSSDTLTNDFFSSPSQSTDWNTN